LEFALQRVGGISSLYYEVHQQIEHCCENFGSAPRDTSFLSGAESTMAKAYLVSRLQVRDMARYNEVRPVLQRLAGAFDGVLIARSETVEVIEGEPPGGMLNIFEFPDLPSLHRAMNSPEYAEVRALQHGTLSADVWVVTGV
jgi:uncharacterized protein (DUF1330 family)